MQQINHFKSVENNLTMQQLNNRVAAYPESLREKPDHQINQSFNMHAPHLRPSRRSSLEHSRIFNPKIINQKSFNPT
jgi:hypothetical protein